MVSVFKRLALILVAATIFSACSWQNNVEAKANIGWTTTNVILEAGKCTVKGYFKNNGDSDGKVTSMRFTVDVKTSENGYNIYSKIWETSKSSLENCYIPAGGQRYWRFWLEDKHCPRWSGAKKPYVQYYVQWKNL